ncbi:MAG: L-threonylcarbamoyladenylate synthase [Thermoplasmataceae archaeon]
MPARVLKVDQNKPDPGVMDAAAEIIIGGGTVVFPTETVYGLGANALSAEACRKIFSAKRRPADNPLIIHICSMSQLDSICRNIPDTVRTAMERIWPGPVTLLLERKQLVPDIVTAGLPTVAVRMPANPLALELIKRSGTPIAAPSANIATRPSIVDSSDAIKELGDLVDMILDAGRTYFGIESTIVDVTREPYVMLRPGVYSPGDLKPFLGEIVADKGNSGGNESQAPLAPGMKYTHYSPDKPLILITDEELFRKIPSITGRVTLIGTHQMIHGLAGDNISLGNGENPYEVASRLFKAFRELEEKASLAGCIHTIREEGIGLAVMNRIGKAASRTIGSETELRQYLESLSDPRHK